MSDPATINVRSDFDDVTREIADYVAGYRVESEEAYETARYCLADSIGCAVLALGYPECAKLMGPIVAGTVVPHGARVPGTQFELDPVQAAFDIGCALRWLDYNDTWLAAEWGHPSDNLGAILAVADHVSRRRVAEGGATVPVSRVLEAMIKAHEIQGVLALENSFNRVGLDHVLLVRVASTAVATHLLGGGRDEIMAAVSNAWLDGGGLRTYRHAPNTGTRKSWAAGDATARGVRLALMSLVGEMGYPSALSARDWGFQEVLFRGEEISLERSFGSYVMENVLFKVAYPAEFHAQTAAECAVSLHQEVAGRLEEVEWVEIMTQEPATRIIDKRGPLHNPADRDHCLQYVVAAGLIFGDVIAEHYEDSVASDPRIDALREQMQVREDQRFTRDYYDTSKRSIANAVRVYFNDGSATEKMTVEYPLGHRRRREEGTPLLIRKLDDNLKTRYPVGQAEAIKQMVLSGKRFHDTPVPEFMATLVI